MRLLVCGGRDYQDKAALRLAMRELRPSLVITGGARGADGLANEIAAEDGKPRVIYPANWTGEGRSAGFLRNRRMLEDGRPDRILAAHGGRGTADMVERSRAAEIPVTQMGASPYADDFGDLI